MDPVVMQIEQYEAVISMYNVMVAMQMGKCATSIKVDKVCFVDSEQPKCAKRRNNFGVNVDKPLILEPLRPTTASNNLL